MATVILIVVVGRLRATVSKVLRDDGCGDEMLVDQGQKSRYGAECRL
jgi:hypothetical protein